MRKLLLVMVLAGVATALGCSRSASKTESPADADPSLKSAKGTKHAWIYFTKNYDKGGGSPYNTDCVATVVGERIGTQKGYKIIWHIRTSNGVNDDDRCEMLDTSKVNLRFNTDVMGAAAMKKLTASGTTIQGTVSTVATDVGAVIDHKYQVFVDNDAAGPDPIIVVSCGGCGDPP
jgi:hypothetical protein